MAVLLALSLALAASWFGTLDYRKLIKSDEGRYAEIAREMAASGDWVTPRYNGVKYFEKPVLLYWATAAAFRLFGENEWTARLWVGLTGFAAIVLAFLAGKALFGMRAGILAAAVLASSPLWVLAGHLNTTDMGVAFFLHGALCSFLLAHRAGIPAALSRRYMLACWAAMALAVLSKGLIGVVLPALALAAYLGVARDPGLLGRLHIGKGLLLFLAIAVPWYAAVSLRNPEFPGFFFIHEHFGRYTTVEGYNRSGPWWFFAGILAAGMLPWTLIVPAAFAPAMREIGMAAPAGAVRPRLMLALWTLSILLFFSVSRSKLPGYIVPVLPAMAMLCGAALTGMSRKGLTLFLLGGAALAAGGLAVYTWVAAFFPDELRGESHVHYGWWLRWAGGLGIAGAVAALLVLHAGLGRRTRVVAVAVYALFVHLAAQTAVLGHESFRARMSAYDIAQEVNKVMDRTQPFYAVRVFDHTLPFYMEKTMTLVEHQDELAFGLSREPALWVPTVEEFEGRWRADRAPMALMQEPVFERLRLRGLPMRIVVRDARRIVVAKP